MKTVWKSVAAYVDEPGVVYKCQCPQRSETGLDHLYSLYYDPSTSIAWFWDEVYDDSVSVRVHCETWDEAETIKRMLTMGKSRWMEPSPT